MGRLDSIAFVNSELTRDSSTILQVEFIEMYFDPYSETRYNYLTANVSWTATPLLTTWVTVSPSSGTGSTTLNIAVEENNSDYDRSGEIRITGGGKTITITVIQYGISR